MGIGYVLSFLGRPLNSIILNIRKLLALAFVIVIFLIIKNVVGFNNLNGLLFLLIISTGLFVISLFITGALLSLFDETNSSLLLIHNTYTILILISSFFALNLINSKR